jgi:hypothetical protein
LVRIASAAGARISAYPRALGSARFELFTPSKENTMNRRTALATTATALLCFAVGLSASDSLAQQKSLKEQLVGTWTLVSSDQVRPDGSTLKQFGANPKGINVFDANGRLPPSQTSSRCESLATTVASADAACSGAPMMPSVSRSPIVLRAPTN